MAVLFFNRGSQEVLRFPLTGPELRIGRHPSNDLTLPDEEISRFHASFEQRDGNYWIVDQSTNGTTVNDRRVAENQLRHGDKIGVGSWTITYSDDPVWGEQPTVVQKKSKPANRFSGMIGQSESMKKVFSMIEKVSPTETTVLVLGETGSGKELVARAIHERSRRAQRPFVPLNCGAISSQLIESELFGHERGSFTGALGRHAGAFEQAEGGTLFLDEVGELPLELQPKLLRVLEEKRFRRVGGTQELVSNVRIIAATHRNLESLVREGKFREDLFYRLYAVPIILPPLRERSQDIPLLIDHFVELLGVGEGKKRLTEEAIQKMINHSWKGNIRELKNVMTRTLLLAPQDLIRPEDVLFLTSEPISAKPSLIETEREAIVKALKENNWNKKKTAETLGIAKSTLFLKINDYQIKATE